MITIIVCASVVVFIALFSEIRVGLKEIECLELETLIENGEEKYKKLHTLSSSMLEDYEALYEVMADRFTDDEIDEMVYNKKQQLLEDDIND